MMRKDDVLSTDDEALLESNECQYCGNTPDAAQFVVYFRVADYVLGEDGQLQENTHDEYAELLMHEACWNKVSEEYAKECFADPPEVTQGIVACFFCTPPIPFSVPCIVADVGEYEKSRCSPEVAGVIQKRPLMFRSRQEPVAVCARCAGNLYDTFDVLWESLEGFEDEEDDDAEEPRDWF